MNKRAWNVLQRAAESQGDEYFATITELGRSGIEALQEKIKQRVTGSHFSSISDSAWALAIYRYQTSISARDFTPIEIDKILHLSFVMYVMHDNLWHSLQDLMQEPIAVSAKDDSVIRDVNDRLSYISERHMEYGVKGNPSTAVKDIVETARRLGDIAIKQRKKAHAQATNKERSDQIKSANLSLKQIGSQMEALEIKLGLQIQHEQESAATFISGLLAKVERYAELNPREFDWLCPECGWKGTISRRVPPSGSIVNQLDLHWAWACPECGTILAGNRKHPLFDGKLVFSYRAWELVKKGSLSLKGMAYILEVSVEHIVAALQTIYHEDLPTHVQKEWDEYESGGIENRDDVQV